MGQQASHTASARSSPPHHLLVVPPVAHQGCGGRGRGRDPVIRPSLTQTKKLINMEETYSTRVKAPAQTSVRVSTAAGNRMYEVPPLKPKSGLISDRGRSSTDEQVEKGLLFTAKSLTTVGTWNVRTLYHTGAAKMLIPELERLRWNIIGMAETHWTGSQESNVQGYKIISSGKERGHSSGVGLILAKEAQRALLSYNPVNDRIISARFQMATGFATLCQVYAPTADSSEEDIDKFYLDLQQEINRTQKEDLLIIMGDFNAKVGIGDEDSRQVMGKFGIGQRNDRGERLIDFCYTNDLFITNTAF